MTDGQTVRTNGVKNWFRTVGQPRAVKRGAPAWVLLGLIGLTAGAPAPGPASQPQTNLVITTHRADARHIQWLNFEFMAGFYDLSLALSTVLLLAALGWSISLRRRVREQTDQIRAQLLREADLDRKYKELFENAHDMVFSLDRLGRFNALNRTAERVLGCSRQQCFDRKLRDFVMETSRPAFDEWMAKCMAEAKPMSLEFEIRSANGGKSFLELSSQPVLEGNQITGVQGIARDVTERKQAEEALRQSEERFASAFRVSPVAISVSSLKDGTYIDANQSFLRLFGFQRGEVIGRTATELNLWADPRDQENVCRQLEQGRSVGGIECNFRVRSGEIRKTLLFVEPIDLNNMSCALTIVHDMTERIALEEQVRNATKLEAVGRLAAGVAHDFNNLLTVIQGHAEMALYQNSHNPAVAKGLDRIADAARKAANLTRQLLTFSRKQPAQPKPLELNELISSATRMFKHLLPDEVSLHFGFSPQLPIINADPTMVEQLIMNLVVNARDAMPKGGDISIGTSCVHIDQAYLKTHPEASAGYHVRLKVSDTGCGMDPATQARIFEPFFTTKEAGKGTGLGLATVYGIVKQHKGWIEVASEPGKGSTFCVYFPSGEPPEALSSKANSRGGLDARKSILVVEDEPAVAELARAVLQEDGHRVFEANDGLGAIQVWNDNRGRIDLVLADISMPRGMSGVDLAENLHALQPDLKFIYMSGANPEEAGADPEFRNREVFLAKPFSAAHLQQAVRAKLNSRRTLSSA